MLLCPSVCSSVCFSPTPRGRPAGPWVELASDGGLDVRSVTAPGMACPKVVGDGTALASKPRGKADGDYPVQVCVAHAAAATRAITVDGLPVPALPNDDQADRGDRRHRLPPERQLHAGLQRSGEVAVRRRGPSGRRAPSGPGDPCRRLPLPRNGLSRHAARLRRQSARRQLGGMAEGLLRSCRAAAGGRTLGAGARQSRTVQPRRPWLVPPARSASRG